MTLILSILILLLACGLLLVLAIIDLKTRLLPNVYVFPFALLAPVFHVVTGFSIVSASAMITGGVLGGGSLLLVRGVANRLYKRDTLGLGDVKLMGAAGLWLGADSIFLCIALGAFLGVLHGAGVLLFQRYKTGKASDMKDFSIPAGPGFIAGIILIGMEKFAALPHLLPL